MLLSWWAGCLVLIPGTMQRETRFNHFNYNETHSNFDTLRCDCSLVSCDCCGGYDVKLTFSNLSSLDLNSSVKFLSNACSALSCESINNSNGQKLAKIQSCRETIGAVQCYSYSRWEAASVPHTVLHSHPPPYFGRFLVGSPGIEENHLSSWINLSI